MSFLMVFVLLVLLFIAWQDFKFRAVYWWLFLLATAGLTYLRVVHIGWELMGKDLVLNGIFLGAQLFFLSLYFSVKQRKLVNIFKGYFGLGDLFFLISIMGFFSFFNYILFYLCSLFLVMLISLIMKYFRKTTNPKIPLAGEQALLFIAWVLLAQLNQINLFSDSWIINSFNL